jgi:hypothetical protein
MVKMEKYLFVYYGGKMANTPAEQKKSMDDWMNWFKKQGKAVVDAGNPTMPGKSIAKGSVTEIKGKMVTGYSIFTAANMDAAVAIAKTSPQLEGGQIEIYQIMAMM